MLFEMKGVELSTTVRTPQHNGQRVIGALACLLC